MTAVTISLPWPPSELSPNGPHGHWAKRAKAKKAYRNACFITTREQRQNCPPGKSFDVLLTFVPPDRRRYDRDNLVARMKSGLDGLAQAWLIDDRLFVRVAGEIAEARQPARGAAEVLVTVSEHYRPPITVDL